MTNETTLDLIGKQLGRFQKAASAIHTLEELLYSINTEGLYQVIETQTLNAIRDLANQKGGQND